VHADVPAHQRQIETAETRLTQAQALLMDIRAGLQTLGSQKAVVDHVIEQSGQLAFEVKEAEALLEALRREREMTQRIHDAVKELRDDDSAERAS
jgi:predicted nuclease with TOPRIM domain